MAKDLKKPDPTDPEQGTLFDASAHSATSADRTISTSNGSLERDDVAPAPQAPADVRAIQDLLWKEAQWALTAAEGVGDDAAFEAFLAQHLPQNSPSTRTRYAQTLMRWFFPDGVRGLAVRVWLAYRDQLLGDEILRYLYLRAEPMAGAAVAEALLPIAESAVIPDSYLPNFIRARFGEDTPDKTIRRLKTNLRKLGFLVRGKGGRDTLRAPSPSGTGFLLVLHYLFARRQAGAVEFRAAAADPFWKYLGFKTEDQLRALLKQALDRDLLAKYVLADRIESISFRYTFEDFVAGKMAL